MHLRTRTIRGLLAFSFVLLIAGAGCPTLKLGEVTVKPGSGSATGFTLQSTIVVEEVEETEGEDQSRQSGKGLLGLHLPAGWSVAAARMKAPTESTERILWAAPQAAGAFAESFPNTGGVWWAFSSPTQEIPKGLHTYQLEVDVVVPKKTKAGSLGLSVTVLSDDLTDLPAPLLYDAAIKGKNVTLAKKGPAALSAPPPAKEGVDGKAPSGG